MYVQAIIESDPFGIDYRAARAEEQLGIDSAKEMHCEHNFKACTTALCITIILSHPPQVISLCLIVSVKRLISACII